MSVIVKIVFVLMLLFDIGKVCRTKIFHFSKTKIYFHKKTTPKLLGYIGLQTMKVGVKSNIGRLATIFQICAMDANILCYDKLVIRHLSRDLFPYLVIK